MKILFMGIKASGKGTQAELISKKLKIPHISSGDLLRNINKKSKLGQRIRSYIDRGIYVPDKLVLKLLLKRLEERDCINGFITDGFPRTLNQAKEFDRFHQLDKVIFIEIGINEALKRITGRRVCSNPNCNLNYNIYTSPKPKVENICDVCGSKLFSREDETKEASQKRIKSDLENIAPMLDYYKKKGILSRVDGEKSINEVNIAINKILNIA